MSSTHTPTPWKMETVKTSVGVCHKIGPLGSSTKIHHACLYDDSYSDKSCDLVLLSDAAFIVRAVNSHDALLAACKEIWKLVDDGVLVRDISRDFEPNWILRQIPVVRSLRKLEEAIKLAEGSDDPKND